MTDLFVFQRKHPDFQELYDLIESTGFAYFHILCREIDMDPSLGKESKWTTDLLAYLHLYLVTHKSI
jgi:hypothetical protein